MNNAKVYALADRFEVLDLKELAKSKFEISFTKDPSAEVISEVIGFVYGHTPSNDRSLRDLLADYCAKQTYRLQTCPEFRSIMESVGAFCFDLSLGLIASRQVFMSEHTCLTKEKNLLFQENATLKEEMERLERVTKTQQAHAEAKLEQAKDLLNTNSSCRHCSANFFCYFENLNMYSQAALQLRCAECQTRHTLSSLSSWYTT